MVEYTRDNNLVKIGSNQAKGLTDSEQKELEALLSNHKAVDIYRSQVHNTVFFMCNGVDVPHIKGNAYKEIYTLEHGITAGKGKVLAVYDNAIIKQSVNPSNKVYEIYSMSLLSILTFKAAKHNKARTVISLSDDFTKSFGDDILKLWDLDGKQYIVTTAEAESITDFDKWICDIPITRVMESVSEGSHKVKMTLVHDNMNLYRYCSYYTARGVLIAKLEALTEVDLLMDCTGTRDIIIQELKIIREEYSNNQIKPRLVRIFSLFKATDCLAEEYTMEISDKYDLGLKVHLESAIPRIKGQGENE